MCRTEAASPRASAASAGWRSWLEVRGGSPLYAVSACCTARALGVARSWRALAWCTGVSVFWPPSLIYACSIFL